MTALPEPTRESRVAVHRWAYGPDSLRAAKRCDTCGGNGTTIQYDEDDQSHNWPCPADCDRGIRVVDEGRLEKAVTLFCRSHPRPQEFAVQWNRLWETLGDEWHRSNMLCFWRHRQNQPWQSALEAAVLAHEADPLDPASWEDMGRLLEVVKSHRGDWSVDFEERYCCIMEHHGATNVACGEGDGWRSALFAACLFAATRANENTNRSHP